MIMTVVEELLDGKSILDFKGAEQNWRISLLLDVIVTRRLEGLTNIEFQAVIEKLIDVLIAKIIENNSAYDWRTQSINKDTLPENWKEWLYYSLLIFGFEYYLSDITLWDYLSLNEKVEVAKFIMNYLIEGNENII